MPSVLCLGYHKGRKIEREGGSSAIKERPVLISTDVTEEERLYTGIAELIGSWVGA
jgi:hypothetical protein